MITIKKSPTADTRTCDFANVSKPTLLASSQQHIDDVRHALAFFGQLLQIAATDHDRDKITDIDGFHRDFVTGFAQTTWWDAHRKLNRHHLLQPDGVRDDVNLIDVLDLIADCVVASMARSGEIAALDLDPDVLIRAFENTVTLLMNQVRVEDEPDEDALDELSFMTPAACAERLLVSPDYIIGEIKDGKLPARVRTHDSGRTRYRIDRSHFADYIERHWPTKNRRQPRLTPAPQS